MKEQPRILLAERKIIYQCINALKGTKIRKTFDTVYSTDPIYEHTIMTEGHKNTIQRQKCIQNPIKHLR